MGEPCPHPTAYNQSQPSTTQNSAHHHQPMRSTCLLPALGVVVVCAQHSQMIRWVHTPIHFSPHEYTFAKPSMDQQTEHHNTWSDFPGTQSSSFSLLRQPLIWLLIAWNEFRLFSFFLNNGNIYNIFICIWLLSFNTTFVELILRLFLCQWLVHYSHCYVMNMSVTYFPFYCYEHLGCFAFRCYE